jgi:hypothetical protein
MVILLVIWFGYGFGGKTFVTTNIDEEVAKDIARKMMEYLHFLPEGGEIKWVFNGPNPKLPKRRAISQTMYRARKTSKAVWLYFVSGKRASLEPCGSVSPILAGTWCNW